MLKADGFDAAIIGVGQRCGSPDFLVYDYDKCVAVLILQGMSDTEALEYMEFNVVGAYMGDQTPVFLHTGESVYEVSH
jgi:hypothetical protein|tara:strand:- start:183 stop:416 length:234 start_codon:yes stop_codon:yes gene_type:complete